MNEQYYDQIVSLVFWKNSRIAKSSFEINWPLEDLNLHNYEEIDMHIPIVHYRFPTMWNSKTEGMLL